MSRPDSRLLVSVSALPFVPEGARWWSDDPYFPNPFTCTGWRNWSPSDMLDASAPELRDGLPVRLDALPWLLKVLHPDALWVDKPYADTDAWLLRKTDGYGARWFSRNEIDWLSGSPIFLPALDVSGLTPDEAARAVVVAAVVARGAK